jgi:hypothetical protein
MWKQTLSIFNARPRILHWRLRMEIFKNNCHALDRFVLSPSTLNELDARRSKFPAILKKLSTNCQIVEFNHSFEYRNLIHLVGGTYVRGVYMLCTLYVTLYH